MNILVNPIALRKAKIVYNFGLSECNRVKFLFDFTESLTSKDFSQYLQILQLLLPKMPGHINSDGLDSSDSEEDMDISDPVRILSYIW